VAFLFYIVSTILLIIKSGEKIVHDLATVIQMRAKISSDKGNKLVVISSDEFGKMIKNDQKINGVTKLSFLHHGYSEFGYVNKISNYIEHLPDLKAEGRTYWTKTQVAAALCSERVILQTI
jgi:hypothetical protein